MIMRWLLYMCCGVCSCVVAFLYVFTVIELVFLEFAHSHAQSSPMA